MNALVVRDRHGDASPVDVGDYVSAVANASICMCIRCSLSLYEISWIIRALAVCACVTTMDNVACKWEREDEG